MVCPLCEAGCGMLVDIKGDSAVGIRPYEQDRFSKGYVCPKGLELLNLDNDPDRLRTPVRKDSRGRFQPVSWDEALDEVAEKLSAIKREHGPDAIATYMGTVMVHKHSALLMRGPLLGALGTRNVYGASSQDTGARFVASYLLYGQTLSIPIPDIDRTDYFLCMGANPLVSGGSLMTAPNARGRLREIRSRGGKIVVIDPRRSETAMAADEHHFIRPSTDAALLFAMVRELVDQKRADLNWLKKHTRGFEALIDKLPSAAEAGPFCGIEPQTIERLAREFADAKTSVAYSRMGPQNARFGTLACFALDLLNMVAGRMGAVGGAMFPKPAIDLALLSRLTRADGFDRYRSRVRGLPEVNRELPATVLADEIETEGEGQVRAMLTYAGNPVLSVPNGRRLARALEKLEFMVSIDIYVNETTRFSDLILPPAPATADDHLDLFFANARVRNGVRWYPAALPRAEDQRLDWEILWAITERLGGGATAIKPVDALLRALKIELTPDKMSNLALRTGPYGAFREGLSEEKLKATEGGLDLGPLQPGLHNRVVHSGGRIRLQHSAVQQQLDALNEAIKAPQPALRLIGRRSLRSNNSWMHNLPRLVKGKDRSSLIVHPEDAKTRGLKSGDQALMKSAIHSGPVTVQVSDEVAPGVVSLPHGFGHAEAKNPQRVASKLPGASANDWIDDNEVEAIAAQSILNGVEVELRAMD